MTAPSINGYDIRDGIAEDRAFVLATFLRGLYYGDSWWQKIPKDIFMAGYKGVIEALFDKGTVKVACLKDDPNTILGYSLMTKDYQTVHWVYIKKDWRHKFGIYHALTPAHPLTVSHLSPTGEAILKAKFPNTVFNPFKLL